MASFKDWLIVVHVISGFTGFLLAPVAVFVKHGGKVHRLVGKIFSIGMLSAAITAWILVYIKPNPFLLMVGIFSSYMVCNGYRVLFRKKITTTKQIPIIDWLIVLINLLACIGLILKGIFSWLPGSFGYIAIVLGSLGSLLSFSDIKLFLKPSADKKMWLYVHIRNMIGAWIAAVTAFSATNITFMPTVIQWLWPSVIGGYAINYFTKKYKTSSKSVN
ncbi:MAG: hypothetical protein RIQ89_913 [Bacteroidota bacterium]